jgi:hypothetical protein
LFLKRAISKNRKVFFLYTFVITILVLTVLVSRYVYESFGTYYLVTRIYNTLEYSLLSYLFYLYIKNRIVRKILLFSSIPYVLFCTYDFIRAKEPSLAFFPLITEYLVLLPFIIYFFFEVMQENVVEPIYNKAIFWISVAFIINFSGNFFLLLSSVNSFQDEEFRYTFTIIYSSVTILKNILLCIAVTIKENNSDNQFLNDVSIDSDLETFLPFKNTK